MDTKKIEAAVAQIIEAVGEDGSREGLQETPQRIAKMYQEIFAGLGETAEEHLFQQPFARLLPEPLAPTYRSQWELQA